jgi:hypothetical protein
MSALTALVDELPAWTEDDSARLTAALVVLDGHQMGRLRRAERIAAIRLGTEKGLSREVMAKRLGLSLDALAYFARRYKVPLPPPVEPPRLLETLLSCSSRGRKRARNQRSNATTNKETQ